MAERPTLKGDRLAVTLAEHIGSTYAIRCTCAAIVRETRRFERAEMIGINGAPQRQMVTYGMDPLAMRMLDEAAAAYEERADKAATQAQYDIEDLVSTLPQPDGGPWTLRFANGYVHITAPGSREFVVEV